MMTPYDCYRQYLALKQHFTRESYDYFAYNGKVRASEISFDKRKDKPFFYKLSNESDYNNLLLANIIYEPKLWIGDLLSDKAQRNYKNYLRDTQSLTYTFKSDLDNMDPDFNSNFICVNGQRPPLLKLHDRNEVTLHTMVILDSLVGYISKWDKEIVDPIVWPATSLRIKKYKPFLDFNENKFKKIVLERFSSDK